MKMAVAITVVGVVGGFVVFFMLGEMTALAALGIGGLSDGDWAWVVLAAAAFGLFGVLVWVGIAQEKDKKK